MVRLALVVATNGAESVSPLTYAFTINVAVIACAMTLLWMLSLKWQNASIVDPFWGTGFVLVTMTTAIVVGIQTLGQRSWLLLALVTIWGLRLSVYLLLRNWGHSEDKRYRAMRDHFSPRFWWISLPIVFWLQAILLWIVSLPIQTAIVMNGTKSLGTIDAIGIAAWFIGMVFESVGDIQMAQFQANPANADRVMDRGLWRYTRHPNYFGDFCVWWGLYLISASGGAWWTIFSPLLMSFLLLKVSGVTLLEKTITSRRPDYVAYQRHTNAFFPGPRWNSR